jgi:LacI family transcriptional regulator
MKTLRFRVSQKRIAQEAGVSQSTVSLILAGRRVNSDETTQRVLEVAKRHHYRPNLLVRGMQTGKTNLIGVMMPPFDFYWMEVLYGIHDVLATADHTPITLWTTHVSGKPRDREAPGDDMLQIHRLLDRRVDGVILWPPFARLFAEFSARNLPVVSIDQDLGSAKGNADYVGSDEASGGRMIAEHLYAEGHRRVAHLAAPAVNTWATARRTAFEKSIRQMPGASCLTVQAPEGANSLAIDVAREMLSRPDRPTAIFAATDHYAKVIYKAAEELGLEIPRDVSVVGFADDDFAREMSPSLTTIRQPGYEIGKKAAEVVVGRSLGTLKTKVRYHELPVTLIVRESSRPIS